jgi:hypothetical protein
MYNQDADRKFREAQKAYLRAYGWEQSGVFWKYRGEVKTTAEAIKLTKRFAVLSAVA